MEARELGLGRRRGRGGGAERGAAIGVKLFCAHFEMRV